MKLYKKLQDKFENIYMITLSNRYDRHSHIMSQFNKIGYNKDKHNLNIIYATPFPYNSIIIDAFNKSGKGRFTKPNEYDCARNHYSIIKQAYDLGYNYCLVIEDDVKFLADETIWNDYLKNVPDDFDIIQFGGFTVDPKIDKYIGQDKGYWVKHKDVGIWTTSMYALSRKGMQFYLAFMDKLFWVADGPLYKAPLNDKIINTYISTIPLVIQADKNEIVSDIRDKENDNIDYNNSNRYEKFINDYKYF